MAIILDTSAVVAWLGQERGWHRVDERLADAVISAVTLAETVEVLSRKGVGPDLASAIEEIPVEPFDRTQALVAASLLVEHRRSGFSLGDACCIALAVTMQAEVYTADHIWGRLGLPVSVTLIR